MIPRCLSVSANPYLKQVAESKLPEKLVTIVLVFEDMDMWSRGEDAEMEYYPS